MLYIPVKNAYLDPGFITKGHPFYMVVGDLFQNELLAEKILGWLLHVEPGRVPGRHQLYLLDVAFKKYLY